MAKVTMRGPELAIAGGFRNAARKAGLEPTVQDLLRQVSTARDFLVASGPKHSPSLRRTIATLGLSLDDRVLLRVRRQGAGGQWMQMVSSWMPADLFEAIRVPSFQSLAEKHGIAASGACECVMPHRLEHHEAQVLGRPDGSLALSIWRAVYADSGRCLEVATIVRVPQAMESCYRYSIPDARYGSTHWPWDADSLPHADPIKS